MLVVTLARRPLSESNVAANVLAHGCGALAIDASRIAHASAADLSKSKNPGRQDTVSSSVYGADRPQQSVNEAGRWPANFVLVHLVGCGDSCVPGCPIFALDLQSGERAVSGAARTGRMAQTHDPQGVTYFGDKGSGQTHDDAGTASRYFAQFGSKRLQ